MLLARVPDVLERALNKVDGTDLTVEDFRKNSSVTQALGSDLLTFAVKDVNPSLAVTLATAYAKHSPSTRLSKTSSHTGSA